MDTETITKDILYILEFEKLFAYQEKVGNLLRKSSSASTIVRKEGNKMYIKKPHNKDIHRQILSLYNKSVALAPPTSQELALAYSNRSALLFHLGKYKESVADVYKALQFVNCEQIKVKLEMRRQECLNLICREVDEETSPPPLPQLEMSKELPCASKSVSLEYSDKYGRHLVANEDISPGQLLIIEESYSCPDPTRIYLVCHHCMAYAWNGVPCDKCALVMYCSDRCKSDAWQEYHDVECATLPYLYCKKYVDIKHSVIILTSQLFIKTFKKVGLQGILDDAKLIESGEDMQINGFLPNGVFDSKQFSSFYNLGRSVEDTAENSKFFGSLIVYVLLKHTNILQFDTLSMSNFGLTSLLIALRNIVINMKSIIQLNAYSFQGATCSCQMPVECAANCDSITGLCVAVFCSLINHSCRPNLSRMFLPGNKIVFFTVSPVKKGDKLCDSYGPCSLSVDKITRALYLKEKFNFICDCQACVQDWPETALYPQARDGKVCKQLQLKTNSIVNSIRIAKIFSKDDLDDVSYEDDLFQTAVKMSKMVHKHFTGFKAYSYALQFEEYIDLAMAKLYGERNRILDKC